MCNDAFMNKKITMDKFSQKHVYVLQNKSAVTDTGCVYVCVCACTCAHSGYAEDKIAKIGTQREYDYIHFSSNHFI